MVVTERSDKPILKPILAIETSTPVARVVIVDPGTGARLAGAEAAAARHSSNLLRLCVESMGRALVSVGGLGAIACGAGPGSFTGLRVGLAVAKGLALPTEIPLVLVSSLEALAIDMAAVIGAGELMVPCLDAGKGQVYAALFERGTDGGVTGRSLEWAVFPADLPATVMAAIAAQEEEVTDAAAPVTARSGLVFAGPGAERYWPQLAVGVGSGGRLVEIAGPSAGAVAMRAIAKLARGETADLGTAVPSYGRPPDITKPRRPAPGS